jgi:hypothetical protein
MKTRKNPPVKFTKQKMIEDINSLRKTTMKCQLITSDICKLYPSLYNYKIVNNLIQLGLLRLAQKKGKSSYYKWNFDSKVDLETFDALFRNIIAHKKNVKEKYAQNKIIRIKKQELIKSQQKANLQTEEPISEPIKEVVMKEIEMPEGFEIWSSNAQARYLDLVPTEEEVQGWKDEIEELKSKIEKKSIELKDLKSEMAWKDNYVYSKIDDFENKLAEKEKHYEKLLSEKSLEPIFVPKEDVKKPFTPVLKEIKKQKTDNQKPTKYLKLFGYMIYEKN